MRVEKITPICMTNRIRDKPKENFYLPKKVIGLAVDFDETLVESINAIVELINTDKGLYKDPNKTKLYNFTDIFPDITAEEINSYFEDPRFFNMLQFKPHSLEFLKEISKDYKIKIVTIGTPKNLEMKHDWIKFNIMNFVPCIEFVGIEHMRGIPGKGMIDLRGYVLIDDHQKNLESSNATTKVLYRNREKAEWNNRWKGEAVTDIIQAYKYFC